MRQAHIFYKDQSAGILTENDAGYELRFILSNFKYQNSHG